MQARLEQVARAEADVNSQRRGTALTPSARSIAHGAQKRSQPPHGQAPGPRSLLFPLCEFTDLGG
jgi:hypothetical protein